MVLNYIFCSTITSPYYRIIEFETVTIITIENAYLHYGSNWYVTYISLKVSSLTGLISILCSVISFYVNNTHEFSCSNLKTAECYPVSPRLLENCRMLSCIPASPARLRQ